MDQVDVFIANDLGNACGRSPESSEPAVERQSCPRHVLLTEEILPRPRRAGRHAPMPEAGQAIA